LLKIQVGLNHENFDEISRLLLKSRSRKFSFCRAAKISKYKGEAAETISELNASLLSQPKEAPITGLSTRQPSPVKAAYLALRKLSRRLPHNRYRVHMRADQDPVGRKPNRCLALRNATRAYGPLAGSVWKPTPTAPLRIG
jgi:hypothetical protein